MTEANSSNRAGAFARVRQVLRHESLGNLLLRVVAAAGYRTGIWCAGWYVRPIEHLGEPADVGFQLEFVKLAATDADEYATFQRLTSAETFRKRLTESQHCYAARLDGRLATSMWFGTDSVWIDFLGRALTLEPDQIYVFDTHTAPEYRGRRLQTWIRAWVYKDAYERGYRRAVAVVAPENRSSIRSVLRAGYRRTGMLYYINAGALKKELFLGSRS